MMIEQHYDEEVLAEFLAEPRDAVSRDKHLASCDLCLGSLDTLRATARTLKEPAVWGPSISTAPRPETLAFLRGVAKTMADEDATAAAWIKELLAGPREEWAARLAEHPEWRTAGMVRRLLKATDHAIDTVPADALAITAIAAQIADKLAPAQDTQHLQGLARYEHAYALWYTGAVVEAIAEFDEAHTRLADLPSAEFDRSRIDLMRAMSYRMLERRNDALTIASSAAAVFRRYGDTDLYAASRSATAATLQSARRLREAAGIYEAIAEDPNVSERWRIPARQNLALCFRDLGEFGAAVGNLAQAIQGYERLGMMTFRSKARWVLAQIFVQQQRYSEALPLLSDLQVEFEELSMANDVAIVSLDIADVLLALDRVHEIADVCRVAMVYFQKAQLEHTEAALRALAYLQEAAIAGRVTATRIQETRAMFLAPSPRQRPVVQLPS